MGNDKRFEAHKRFQEKNRSRPDYSALYERIYVATTTAVKLNWGEIARELGKIRKTIEQQGASEAVKSKLGKIEEKLKDKSR